MKSLVVLFAIATVACGSLIIAQPPHHPALVLDPHGRPLDTAEVINARAIHLQAKALEGHHAPLVHVAPVVAHSALIGHGHGLGHLLKKRSLGHLALSAPIIAHSPAVSHQSRVDVISSPAVVSHAAPIVSHAVAAPIVSHAIAPAAVSHQSRVDVHNSPAVIAHSVHAAPIHSAWASPIHGANSLLGAHSIHGAHSLLGAHSISGAYSLLGAHSIHGAHAGLGLSHGHLLKKRSLGHIWAPVAHSVPAAVSHQARLDVISSPAVVSHAVAAPVIAHAAPAVIAHATPAVSHQSRIDVISGGHIAPIGYSSVLSAPASHLSHSGLIHSSPLIHGAHW